MEFKKGDINDLRDSINERIDLVLLKKDFTGKIFSRIKLTGARIASCKFNGCGFYGVEFIDTEFTSNSLVNANFESCTFTNCTIYKCDFESATLQNVKFNDCRILSCKWNNVNLSDNVTGLSDQDLKVIHEENEANTLDLTQLGFEPAGDDPGTFIICDQQEGETAPKVCMVVTPDSEMGEDIYRVMFTINDDPVLSDTFNIDTTVGIDYEEIYSLIKYILISGKNKTMKPDFENKEGLQYDLLKKSVDIIKSKLKEPSIATSDAE